MSTITNGSVCPTSWLFAWTVESPLEGSERRSNPFSFKGHEVHLSFTKRCQFGIFYYSVELRTPPSFPLLVTSQMIVRVLTKNKTRLDLPNNWCLGPDTKIFWRYSEDRILEKYPNFRTDGRILRFLLCNVDPPKERITSQPTPAVVKLSAFQTAEKLVQTPELFNDISSLERLSSDLSVLLQKQDSGPDLELLCGEGHSMKVHKNIVSARSKVISAMLNIDMSESRTGRIEIKDMSSDVFDQFVDYLYAGKLPDLNEDSARGLYEAGDQYEVPSLMRRCESFLLENLTPENACELLVLADAHSDQEFKERVIEFIMEHEIPWQDDHWLPFQGNYPKLSNEVLYRFCNRQRTK